jgi:hypothetical protein
MCQVNIQAIFHAVEYKRRFTCLQWHLPAPPFLCLLEDWEINSDFSMVLLVRALYVFSYTISLSAPPSSSPLVMAGMLSCALYWLSEGQPMCPLYKGHLQYIAKDRLI